MGATSRSRLALSHYSSARTDRAAPRPSALDDASSTCSIVGGRNHRRRASRATRRLRGLRHGARRARRLRQRHIEPIVAPDPRRRAVPRARVLPPGVRGEPRAADPPSHRAAPRAPAALHLAGLPGRPRAGVEARAPASGCTTHSRSGATSRGTARLSVGRGARAASPRLEPRGLTGGADLLRRRNQRQPASRSPMRWPRHRPAPRSSITPSVTIARLRRRRPGDRRARARPLTGDGGRGAAAVDRQRDRPVERHRPPARGPPAPRPPCRARKACTSPCPPLASAIAAR